MPTVFSHPAPILALGLAAGNRVIPGRLLLAGVACSLLPDADVVGFFNGIAYGDNLGHRGISHSLVFAGFTGLVCLALAPLLHCKRLTALMVGIFAATTHIALDAATSGGLGVAAFWPWADGRYFLPWRPIRVSPLGIKAFFSARGVAVLYSEFLWIWLPCLTLGFSCFILRKVWAKRQPKH